MVASERASAAQFLGRGRRGFFIAKAVNMGDEIPHMGVVHGALRLGLPCVERRVVVGKDPNDMQVVHILEHVPGGIDELAAKDQIAPTAAARAMLTRVLSGASAAAPRWPVIRGNGTVPTFWVAIEMIRACLASLLKTSPRCG